MNGSSGPSTDLINAGCINWDVGTPDYPLDEDDYAAGTSEELSEVNAGHKAIGYVKGKYTENCDTNFQSPPYDSDIHTKVCFFKVSLGQFGNPLITASNQVAAPCPPFCNE